jgi:hypothetical protein
MELAQILDLEIDVLEKHLYRLKNKDSKAFHGVIDKLKFHFILSQDIALLNKLALIFSTFKIHSAVPCIVAKLHSGKHNQQCGTLVYALKGLRINDFKMELMALGKMKISYEGQVMLSRLNIS